MRLAPSLLSFVFVSAAALAAPFSNLYFFGDSLSDAGNISALTVGNYPGSPYYAGRFSNGPVWAETFATLEGFPAAGQRAGMTLGPNFLNLEIEGPGNNYAIGGARTGQTGTLDIVSIPSGVLTQVYYYLSESNNTADPSALYVLFAGGNDLRDASLLAPAARDAAANTAAFNVTIGAYILAQRGARRFLVLNAPNVGLTPEARIVRNNAAAATAATIQYNSALDYFLNTLSFPNLTISRFDTFGLFQTVYQDALNGGTLTGIANATTPCFAGFAGSLGANCATSLFADDIHPTAQVHALLGFAVANQVQNPEPATIVLVGAALGLLAWRRRRRGAGIR